MSKSYKEQHPLLCDEFSDEEQHIQTASPRHQRRFRCSAYSGRARTHALGATRIITKWPDHLSSILTYWWMGLGMIAVIVFVIYNSILTIAALPPAHARPMKIMNPQYEIEKKIANNSSVPNIFMHVFVKNKEDFDMNEFLPYIKPIFNKYNTFQYNLIVVLNDTAINNGNELSNEENNYIAFNSLWIDRNDNKNIIDKNFSLQFVYLSKIMSESPIRKIWHSLPSQFIEFLTRCIAIWEKGGIAVNPTVLTKNSSNTLHIQKLTKLLDEYSLNDLKSTNKHKLDKKHKKINNIRDVIEALEVDDKNNQASQYNLSEAENKEFQTTVYYSDTVKNKITKLPVIDKQKKYKFSNLSENKTKKYMPLLHKRNSHGQSNYINYTKNNDITSNNLLPMFLKYLFNQTPPKSMHRSNAEDSRNNNTTKSVNNDTIIFNHSSNENTPKTIVTINLQHLNKEKSKRNQVKLAKELTIDLKGNFIASATSCHAFLGMVFSNVIHYVDKETVTDLIIAELSLFCKGLLSSCNGVNVILV